MESTAVNNVNKTSSHPFNTDKQTETETGMDHHVDLIILMEATQLNMGTRLVETMGLEDTLTNHLTDTDNNKIIKMITIPLSMEANRVQTAVMDHTLHRDMIDKTVATTTQMKTNPLLGTHHKHGNRQDNLLEREDPKAGSKLRNT